MAPRPKVNSESQAVLDRAETQFEEFKEQVDQLTLDRMNVAPVEETEPQTKISQKDREKLGEIYLKPKRMISSKEKFNEKFRESYEFDKQYVKFEAENIEIIGDSIDLWTKPYPGVPAENWEVPVNKPVWGPRYLAEQITRCNYHRLFMENRPTSLEGGMTYFGTMAVDKTIHRLNARPVSNRKSLFMGESSFK